MTTMKGRIVSAAILVFGALTAHAAVTIKTVAEVEKKLTDNGKEVVTLAPAQRVLPGTEVFYTVEVRNSGDKAATDVAVTNPIPEHMVYVANSAVGPGAEVSYSVDGGFTYATPDKLRVKDAEGKLRSATPADYTHIRWVLKSALKGNSVAYARFRAILK